MINSINRPNINAEMGYKLYKFFKGRGPAPIVPSDISFCIDDGGYRVVFPVYGVHDLISKDFCMALAKDRGDGEFGFYRIFDTLSRAYYRGGMPEVEAQLEQIILRVE